MSLSPEKREWLSSLLLLACVVCAVYGNIVFKGESLIYSDNMNPIDFRLVDGNYAPGFRPTPFWVERNVFPHSNFHDAGATEWQWEPAAEFLRASLLDGELPLWDPFVGGGVPAWQNLTSTFFFPPYTAMVLAGNTPLLRNIYHLLLAIGSAFAAERLCRYHGLSRAGSLFAGIAWVFSGAMTQNAASFMGQTVAMLPFVLLATSAVMRHPTGKRIAAGAVVFASTALSSFPPILIALFGVALVHAVVCIFVTEGRGERWIRTAAFSGVVILSLLMVSFLYLPALTTMRGLDQLQRAYEGAGQESLDPARVFQLVTPSLSAGGKIYLRPLVKEDSRLFAAGVVCLFFALLSGWPQTKAQRTLFISVALSAVLMSMKIWGVPPVHWIGRLPGFRSIHFTHYLPMVLPFTFAVLAAFGVDRFLSASATRRRLLIVSCFWLAILALHYAMASRLSEGYAEQAARWRTDFSFLVAMTALCSLLVLLGNTSRARTLEISTAALFLLLLAESAWNTVYPRQPRWGVFARPPAVVERLRTEAAGSRVLGLGTFTANAGSAFGIMQLDSLMGFNAPRMLELYRYYGGSRDPLFLRDPRALPPEAVLDAANTGLLIAAPSQRRLAAEALNRGYRSVGAEPSGALLSRRVRPRYFFTADYVVARSPREALERVAHGVLVLEEDPVLQRSAHAAPVEVEELWRNRVLLRVHAPVAGLVYFSESNMPGWTVRINGVEARFLAANYAFRAVRVPAGSVRIEARYVPPGLPAGVGLSVAGLVAALALCASPRRLG